MKLKIWEYALIAAVLLTFVGGVRLRDESRELSDKLIRLHVVANSDSEADQALKLRVRDAVLGELRERLEGVTDTGAAREIIASGLEDIRAASLDEIGRSGFGYDVEVTLCRESFPTTEYDSFSLPAGEYESLRVKIGAAGGHNWWCVVFPPVCDAGAIDETTASAIGLTGEEVRLITASDSGYVFKFRTIELINKLLSLFK